LEVVAEAAPEVAVNTAVVEAVLEDSGTAHFQFQVRSRSPLAPVARVRFPRTREALGRTPFSPLWCQMVVVVVEATTTLLLREALAVVLVPETIEPLRLERATKETRGGLFSLPERPAATVPEVVEPAGQGGPRRGMARSPGALDKAELALPAP
jgi:hypothetical protein